MKTSITAALGLIMVSVLVGCSGEGERPSDDESSSGETNDPTETSNEVVAAHFQSLDSICDFLDIESLSSEIDLPDLDSGSAPSESRYDTSFECFGALGFEDNEVRYRITIGVPSAVSDIESSYEQLTAPESQDFAEDFEELTQTPIDGPWNQGETYIFSDSWISDDFRLLGARYAEDHYTVGLWVRDHVGEKQDSDIEYCPKTDIDSGCSISPEALTEWVASDYLPALHERIEELLS
jgi:hypothetical protein